MKANKPNKKQSESVAWGRSGARGYEVRPGLDDEDAGYTNYFPSVEAYERGMFSGFRSQVVPGGRLLVPRMSRGKFSDYVVSQLPEVEDGFDAIFSKAAVRGTLFETKLRSDYKVVRRSGTDRNVYAVVPRVLAARPESEMENEPDFYAARAEGLLNRDRPAVKVRKYSLLQVLSDVDVIKKFQLSQRVLEAARRLSVSDPALAARNLKRTMEEAVPDVDVSVNPGDCLKDKGHARNIIRIAAEPYVPSLVSCRSEIVAKQIFLYGDDSANSWSVSGPVKYLDEMIMVFAMCQKEGRALPHLWLELPLVLLSINIFDGQTCEVPQIEFHVGSEGVQPEVGLSRSTTALFSTEQRVKIETIGKQLLPVRFSVDEPRQIASAVCVTAGMALVNSHVLDSHPGAMVGNQRVRSIMQVARDVCAVRVECPDFSPWVLREPIVGEKVFLCYVADAQVSTSAPLTVTSVDETCMVLADDPSVVAGTSGAALVAVADLALLGVHSAKVRDGLVGYKFGPNNYASLLEVDTTTNCSSYEEQGSYAERVVERFKSKGVSAAFDVAVESVLPVYAHGVHVGMAVQNGDTVVVAGNTDLPLRFGSDEVALDLEEGFTKGICVSARRLVSSTPVLRRKPNYFEGAFILASDGKAYLTNETSVKHIWPEGKRMVLAGIADVDRPVVGGLVIAVKDGAVLGVCVEYSTQTPIGAGFVVVALPEASDRGPVSARQLLQQRFGSVLNLAAWSDELLEEVFTHVSVGKYSDGRTFDTGCRRLANIGDNAAKALLYEVLRDRAVPYAHWQGVMQDRQSNEVEALLAWEFGLHACLRSVGVAFRRTSKVYADLVEALVGAAYLVETRDSFRGFCLMLRLLPPDDDYEGLDANLEPFDDRAD